MARRQIALSGDDLIAAAQVLSWIAYPCNPNRGLHLLNAWVIWLRKSQGEKLENVPSHLERKPGRMEGPLHSLDKELTRALIAGDWYGRQLGRAFRSPHMSTDLSGHASVDLSGISQSLNSLATNWQWRTGTPGEDGKQNRLRDIWSKRKPVLHLCIATHIAVAGRSAEALRLEKLLFRSDWVREAVERSEGYAELWTRAQMKPIEFHLFHRDSF